MQNKFYTSLFAVAMLSCLFVYDANASFVNLTTGTNVALGTSGVTYTTSGFTEDNLNGDLGQNGNNTQLTITFSRAVDIRLSSTTANFGNVFDGTPNAASSTFVTNGSVWSFAAGANAANANFTGGAGTANFGISQDNGGATSASSLDWGTLTSDGITTLTWNIIGQNREVIQIEAFAVPEPTSAALVALAGFGFIARRRRA